MKNNITLYVAEADKYIVEKARKLLHDRGGNMSAFFVQSLTSYLEEFGGIKIDCARKGEKHIFNYAGYCLKCESYPYSKFQQKESHE